MFLTIETSPIFTKLLSPKSAYDFKLEDEETAIKTNVLQNKNQREAMLKTDYDINDRIYSNIENEDELYTYKRKKLGNSCNFKPMRSLNNNKMFCDVD